MTDFEMGKVRLFVERSGREPERVHDIVDSDCSVLKGFLLVFRGRISTCGGR
jgi:hypothetical protein